MSELARAAIIAYFRTIRSKWFLKCGVVLMFMLQTAGGIYYVLRPQLWSATAELTLSEDAMSEVGQEALYQFVSGPRLRTLLGAPERYLSVKRLGGDRVSIVIFSDEYDELLKRHARLKSLLTVGVSENYRALLLEHEKSLSARIAKQQQKPKAVLSQATTFLFSEFSNLTPQFRQMLIQEEAEVMATITQTEGGARRPASDIDDAGERARIKELTAEFERAKEALNRSPSEVGVQENAVSSAIVSNLVAGRLQFLRDQSWVEMNLGKPALGRSSIGEVRTHGRSVLDLEVIVMALVALSLLNATIVKAAKNLEYDTSRMRRQNYRIEAMQYADKCDKVLEEEFQRCASPSAQLPQRLMLVSIGGSRVACDFAAKLGSRLAESGARVLIFDCIKDPSALRELAIGQQNKGLRQYMNDGLPLSECLSRTSRSSRLMILGLGEGVGLDENTLDNPRYQKLIEETSEFDVVITVCDLKDADEAARASYLTHSILFFASSQHLRREVYSHLPRLFAVYNSTTRRLLEFKTRDVAALGHMVGGA